MVDKEILDELKKQTKWLRFMGAGNLKKTIEENIETKEQKKIYDLSDGQNSTYDISKKLSELGLRVSHMTVYNYWKRWHAIGLVVSSEKYSGRFEKIINLEDLDIR